jgi:hypothetical protein
VIISGNPISAGRRYCSRTLPKISLDRKDKKIFVRRDVHETRQGNCRESIQQYSERGNAASETKKYFCP